MQNHNKITSELEKGWNDFHNGVERDKVTGEENLRGYDLAEAGGLIRTTDYYNDR